MHQSFQQALCRLRLATSRSFVKTLSNGFGPGKPGAFCAERFRDHVTLVRSELGAWVVREAAGQPAGAGSSFPRQSDDQEFGYVRCMRLILREARLSCAPHQAWR